jgi:hypothetical protein
MLVRYPTVVETMLGLGRLSVKFAGTASQRANTRRMPIASDLFNLAALILAGITGALLYTPLANAARLVPQRLRIGRRRD